MKVISIRQTDGIRYLAISDEDARTVRRDRAMIDAISPLACLDVDGGGAEMWARVGDDTTEGRQAIRKYRDEFGFGDD